MGLQDYSFPLFSTEEGVAATKQQVVATIVHVADLIRLPTVSVRGAPIYTGHTLRVTGAIYLASCGIDI